MNRYRLTTLLLLALAGVAAARPLPLWQVDGLRNTVFLLGSVHVLREQDHPLPSRIVEAYAGSDVVYMEIDMDDVDPIGTQALINDLGVLKGETTLSDLLGPDAAARAVEDAVELGIPFDLLQKSEPWLAAMTVEQLLLLRQGFKAEFGVEMTVAALASRDAKPVEGFETIEQQIGFLDGLSLSSQRDMLLQVLATNIEDRSLIDRMIDAWRDGDTAFFETLLDSEKEAAPELYAIVVADRNARWAEAIGDMLDDERNYLVVVGAMHMIGRDGVPALLRDRGFPVNQLQQPEFEETP
jgi:uncharacterized protein YbaP (TraB family)